MEIIKNILTIVICYAMGCLVAGYYLVRVQTGRDLLQIGSGSVGAHNVSRILGKKGYLITAFFDLAKGMLAVVLARYAGLQSWWLELASLAVVTGHLAPLQLRFRGGKGVATSSGTILSLDSNLAMLMWSIFLLVYLIFRDSALAVVVAFLTVPFLAISLKADAPSVFYFSVIAGVIYFTHRRNLGQQRRRLKTNGNQ